MIVHLHELQMPYGIDIQTYKKEDKLDYMLNEIKTKKDILDRIQYIKEEIDSRYEKDMTH